MLAYINDRSERPQSAFKSNHLDSRRRRIMEKKSWRRNHGREIKEAKEKRRSNVREITDA